MKTKIKKADTSGKDTAQTKNLILSKVYQNLPAEQRKKAVERIVKRRADMPKVFRANYDKAMSGKSLRAATKAFCLECVCWQKEEVKLCTALACPLYPCRPFQQRSKVPSERGFSEPESTNSATGVQ